MNILTKKLIENAETAYREFSKKLIPDAGHEILGVRMPVIKNLAKFAVSENVCYSFLDLPHTFHEEFMLHGLIIGSLKDNFESVLRSFEAFLPLIDNWAVCDSTVAGMKIFAKNPRSAFREAKTWALSEKPYISRAGLVTILDYFITPVNAEEIYSLLDCVHSENYYVKTAVSWLLSVLLVKCYDSAVSVFENRRYDKFIHNKAILKATESLRISDYRKNYLKSLKIN